MTPASSTAWALSASLASKLDLFARNLDQYLKPDYKEAQTRVEFIDSLLIALGWDVGNTAGAAERFKEVVVEPTQQVEGRKRSPDYVLRVGGTPVIFVEAKKPSVKIATDKAAAHQARSYAWSAQLPIVVLTNFAEVAIYNGLVRPKVNDTARTARLFYTTFDKLSETWPEIDGLVSRPAVHRGDLDRFVNTLPARGGSERIDQSFLRDLEITRADLAGHIFAKNPNLTDEQVLTAVQLTIDRLIFLRIAEDRKVETYGSLLTVARSRNPAKTLRDTYRDADARYNSGLFHFDKEPGRSEPDTLTPSLALDNTVIKDVIERFYPPSPYAFSVMPIEILGRVYESFLARRIERSSDGTIHLELKPEVRKAGGVFYTPEWLTKQVVARTIDPLLAGLTPDTIGKSAARTVRVVDPACGSGSFLVAAYRHLLDWHLQHYLQDPVKWSRKRPPRLEKNQSGAWCLSLGERKRILLEHIYGVDIDPQAVEVAKLSLLIVVLEDQSGPGLQEQLAVFKARVLPDLDSNVRCGNSLVGTDFFSDDELVSSAEAPITQPFDWSTLRTGKFQAVVGNPPWLMAGYELPPSVLDYLKARYASYTGKADLYYLFLERSLDVLAKGGRVGMVVPNKMYATRAATGLRELLSHWVESIVDFQTEQIFHKATNYTQVLYLAEGTNTTRPVPYTRALTRFAAEQSWDLERKQLTRDRWDTNSPPSRALWSAIESVGTRLEDIVAGFGNGVQTGSDPLLLLTRADATANGIEGSALKPLLRGQDIRGGSLAKSKKMVVFPYKVTDGKFVLITEVELAAKPGLHAYLSAHKADLQKRRWFGKSATELSGQWWGFMYLDSHATYANPHILSPALSNKSHFALGDGRLTPTGTAGVTVLSLAAGYEPKPLLAILNSRLISTYIVAHSTPYQGSYFKFSAPYLRSVPVVEATTPERETTYTRLDKLWASRTTTTTIEARTRIDQRIDEVVNALYGVTADQVEEAETFIIPLADQGSG